MQNYPSIRTPEKSTCAWTSRLDTQNECTATLELIETVARQTGCTSVEPRLGKSKTTSFEMQKSGTETLALHP